MEHKPVWLLDIDGVINAATSRSYTLRSWPKNSWITVQANGWTLVAAKPVLEFVRRVHDQGLAEIRWHSTWQQHSPKAGQALGLPEFAVQDAPEFATAVSLSPLSAVVEAASRPPGFAA